MAVVVVPGATGRLGRVLVPALVAAGHDVRAMTRSAGRVQGATEVVADVLDPASLRSALAGADCVLHLASSPTKNAQRVEVEGTRNLLAARDAGTSLVYLSIVGCDRTPYAYYRAKVAAEELVRAADDAYVTRATQFHGFAALMTTPRLLGRSVTLRRVKLQPVAESFVADVLVRAVDDPASVPAEVGGPEQLSLDEVAHRAHGARSVHVPLPGRLGSALRSGSLLCGPGAVVGGPPL